MRAFGDPCPVEALEGSRGYVQECGGSETSAVNLHVVSTSVQHIYYLALQVPYTLPAMANELIVRQGSISKLLKPGKGDWGRGGPKRLYTHTHTTAHPPTHTHTHTHASTHCATRTHTHARNTHTHTRLYTNNRHHRVYLTSIKEVHSCGVIRSFSCDHLTSTKVAKA